RPALDGDRDVDVAIVGGGFSGLWTAYYLSTLDPSLRIVLIEKHFCGYGASGRNGGWAVGELAGSFEQYRKRSSPDEAMRQARAVFSAVDEIGTVAAAEGIDCGYQKGGWIRLARTRPQARRQREEIEHDRSLGFTEDEIRLLEPDEARQYLNGTRTSSGIFFNHCAAIDPARLARGLADAVERAGVTIVEDTEVTAVQAGTVTTTRGTVRADVVIQATEAYTRDLAGKRRELLPVYSLMVATEPLTDDQMAEIGLADRPTFSDDRFMVIYGQRTEDNRLAFGGRGVPYRWGSRIARSAELHQPSHELLRTTLVDMLPVLSDVRFTHRWGGVLGIPRDWVPGLRFDRRTGVGVLGGYVGEGVAAANLAGRTMAELIAGEDTERTSLPWVGVHARRWEPEPFRWLGVRSSRRILTMADNREERTDDEATVAFRISRLLRGA
ncbi:MAG: FAD-dependent oxidoreductase, partial [Actinomycetota bacterium]